ncbi:MAG: glycoside hydrolase family 9 protein [Oscillospiraceae bacterium]|nr:glycoside hydrolase family 9 protein [Oscillospiraceae bacterium]
MNINKKLKSAFSAMVAGTIVSSVAVTSAFNINTANAENSDDINFARALQYSIYFYDANMCGTEVNENTEYSWRGDCHTYDAKVAMNSSATNLSESFLKQYKDILDPDGDGFIDVSGGFHDAGDHVKFGMPENYSASTLGWGYYEFRDSYVKLGQDKHIETILRYFNDYLMKCTFLDANGDVIAHCYQVGDGDEDHKYWNSPEIDEMNRPAFFLTADKPQTDYVASAAASLAVNYLNFKDTDPEYANKSLEYSKALFKFAQNHEKQLSDNSDGPKSYYTSAKWEDDYCWAAAWLYKITEDHKYLEEIFPYYDYYAAPCYVHCWNDVWNGVQCILGEITKEQYPDFIKEYKEYAGKSPYEEMDCWASVSKAVDTYMSGGLGRTTAGGFFWLDKWGSARYNTAAQLSALVYDKYNNNGKPSKYSDWAKSQMEYIMGNNPMKRSYIVGYNESSAKFPHHRAASGLTKAEDTDKHRYVLYGALVGGPDDSDYHSDTTADWVLNEVTIDYNAAFVGACAGLYEFYGTNDMKITPDFPPAVSDSGEKGGNNFWVNAYAVDDKQSSGAGVTKLAIQMRTDSITPKTDLSLRYYFSIEEFKDKSNISNVKGDELYDQAAVEAPPADGVISAPIQYNPDFDPNIYYVEVKWDGYKIANSNKKYQFAVGLYYGDEWNPENDWSYQGITKCTDTYQDGSETKTDYICVYSDGVLVGGIEPDGSTPENKDSTEPTDNTSSTDTTNSSIIWGDANNDGTVDVADVVAVASYVGDSKSNPLKQQGLKNADVHSNGNGITADDALTIQQYLAKIIKTLPV